MSTKRNGKTLGLLLALVLFSPLFYFWAVLAWIQYAPLPPVPYGTPEYTVSEVPGASLRDGYRGLHRVNQEPLSLGWHLTDEGRAEPLDEAAWKFREREREAARERVAQRLAAEKVRPPVVVLAVTESGDALVRDDGTVRLWRAGSHAAAMSYGVRGYPRNWYRRIFSPTYHSLSDGGAAIGGAYIATAFASSGGTSRPHGRWMPLLWRGKDDTQPDDLNSLIDPARGWYLSFALGINRRGQILCLGRQTDLRRAEGYAPPETYRLLLLTPTR